MDEKPDIFSRIEALIYCYPNFWWDIIIPAEKPEMLHVTIAHKLTFMDKEWKQTRFGNNFVPFTCL